MLLPVAASSHQPASPRSPRDVASMKVLSTRPVPLQCTPRSRSLRHATSSDSLTTLIRRSCRASSHNSRAELQLGWPYDEGQPFVQPFVSQDEVGAEDRWDVLGLGQAMVDMSAGVEDTLLSELHVEKGARKIISVEDRTGILQGLEGSSYQVAAGGSLSNTLMALARLGGAASARGGRPLRVGMAGLVGSDALGSFYTAQMRKAGVEVMSEPVPGANTGTVVVLTSRDAQRTMLSYLGTSCEIPIDAALEAAIARSRVLVVEGYLWELPGAAAAIGKAIAAAQAHGTVVAMTAGDAGVVERHHSEMWAAIDAGIDLLFTNRAEAEALVKYEPAPARAAAGSGGTGCGVVAGAAASSAAQPQHCSEAEAAALQLGPHCSLVVVTDGSHGSSITCLGQIHTIPPHWGLHPPVDSCGAGDAYAAGLLFGFLRGFDVNTMGRVAARAASAVIAQMGAALSLEAAEALAEQLPCGADRQALRGFGPSASPAADASP